MKTNILKKLFEKKQPQTKPLTQEEKANILEKKLTNFFAEHDKITKEVNLFPSTRARNEVEKMKKEGSLDYYFEWYLLHETYQRNIVELQHAYNRSIEALQARYSQNNCLQVQN